MIQCKECKSSKVQQKMWVEVNTNIVIDQVGEPKTKDKEYFWCPKCNDNCEIIDK